MKPLVDKNISHRILQMIEEYFPGSTHVKNIGEAPVRDRFIWKYAKSHDYIIVIYDQDFYEWQQLKSYPPYVVWLRFGNAPTKYIAKRIIDHKNEILNLGGNEKIGVLEIH